ncbi:hypothetical protein, partial [Candidatus Sororendozoicomonas aggregata]|uniref:hypothetical protein n=1 Tax=Candidatus Sororendozoicomonas aggregata TaxID=3073239 RepID=UPI002ED6A836
KVDDQFSMELFRAFSSMNAGKGLPKEEDVKKVKDWEVWKVGDQFSMKLFRAFSSINHGKGLPKEEDLKKVKGILNWISHKQSLLKLMTRLWASEELPALDVLMKRERQISLLLSSHLEDMEDEEHEEAINTQIKMVVLFLTTRKREWFLNWNYLEQFYEAQTEDRGRVLEKLIKLLSSYGGKGIIDYLNASPTEKRFMLSYTNKKVPLVVLNKAIDYYSKPEDRKQFIFFNNQQKQLPDKAKWEQRLCQLEKLSSVLKYDYRKKIYWKVLQSFSPEDQDYFLDEYHAQSIFDVFPALSCLKKLRKARSFSWFKQLLQACVGLKGQAITREGIQALFEALIIIQAPLYTDTELPNHFLSGMSETNKGCAMVKMGSYFQTPEQLALAFIKAVMWALKDMFFTVKRQTLDIEELDIGDKKIHHFPVPLLVINDDSIEISNWTLKQLKDFVQCIDLPEEYYFTEEQQESYFNPPYPVYIQRKIARQEERKRLAASDITAAPFKPVPIYLLISVINKDLPIKPMLWQSFDYHKEKLPKNMHDKIRGKIANEIKNCPEGIRESLENYFTKVVTGKSEEYSQEAEIEDGGGHHSNREKEGFDSLWNKLTHKEIFDDGVLKLLETYKEQMAFKNLVITLQKSSVHADQSLLEVWKTLVQEQLQALQKRDPCFLNMDEETYDLLDEMGMFMSL